MKVVSIAITVDNGAAFGPAARRIGGAKLKERAVKNGRSAEEEHRVILRDAVVHDAAELSPEYKGMDLKELLASAPGGLADLDFGDRNRTGERPDPFA